MKPHALTDQQEEALFEQWKTCQYTLEKLGVMWSISKMTVSNIITKKLKKK